MGGGGGGRYAGSGAVLHTHYCLEKVVRRRALFIKSATAFAVLAVASAPPMFGERETYRHSWKGAIGTKWSLKKSIPAKHLTL